MKTAAELKIVILGSGNLGLHLSEYFVKQKLEPIVYNHRSSSNLKFIQQKLNCTTQVGFNSILPADIYFLCVKERYIKSVSSKIKNTKANAILLHCSGSMPLDEINNNQTHRGVLYPIQTFSVNKKIDWDSVPFLLQASSPIALKKLQIFAKIFKGKKKVVDDKERLLIHLAAVLVNNFTNALYTEAFKLLSSHSLKKEFNLLLPLINTGVSKLITVSPIEAQTGPAKRGEKQIMQKHLNLLKKDKDLQKLYQLMSKLIINQN